MRLEYFQLRSSVTPEDDVRKEFVGFREELASGLEDGSLEGLDAVKKLEPRIRDFDKFAQFKQLTSNGLLAYQALFARTILHGLANIGNRLAIRLIMRKNGLYETDRLRQNSMARTEVDKWRSLLEGNFSGRRVAHAGLRKIVDHAIMHICDDLNFSLKREVGYSPRSPADQLNALVEPIKRCNCLRQECEELMDTVTEAWLRDRPDQQGGRIKGQDLDTQTQEHSSSFYVNGPPVFTATDKRSTFDYRSSAHETPASPVERADRATLGTRKRPERGRSTHRRSSRHPPACDDSVQYDRNAGNMVSERHNQPFKVDRTRISAIASEGSVHGSGPVSFNAAHPSTPAGAGISVRGPSSRPPHARDRLPVVADRDPTVRDQTTSNDTLAYDYGRTGRSRQSSQHRIPESAAPKHESYTQSSDHLARHAFYPHAGINEGFSSHGLRIRPPSVKIRPPSAQSRKSSARYSTADHSDSTSPRMQLDSGRRAASGSTRRWEEETPRSSDSKSTTMSARPSKSLRKPYPPSSSAWYGDHR
ncbi:hypothetical protein P389DRAFT_169244 [Cystobasidium minutum MCA 4210]|uniref:uncharacterized protein n=1 Tax=Cystobasidium minutum MCA 4210 TaxID=1397322 RepID=UPI0034CEBB82|eukprot:jgi/Rhomi1/169244/fgenesh1_kg.3_\